MHVITLLLAASLEMQNKGLTNMVVGIVHKFLLDFSVDPKDPTIVYNWYEVGVLSYDEKQQLFLVQKTNAKGRILDDQGYPLSDKSSSTTESESTWKMLGNIFEASYPCQNLKIDWPIIDKFLRTKSWTFLWAVSYYLPKRC